MTATSMNVGIKAAPSPRVRLDAPLAIIAAIITGALFWPFATIGIDAHHDGIVLKPALDLLAGQTLFRDTFSQYGATPYMQALTLAFFGPTLAVLRLSTVFVYALCAGALIACWRVFLPRLLALVALGMWLLAAPHFNAHLPLRPWSSVYALLFQTLALFCLLRAMTTPRPRVPAWLCGTSAGLTFLCRESVGGFTFAAVLMAFLALVIFPDRRRLGVRCVLAFLCGFGVVLGVFTASLLATGALQAWYFQTLVWPSKWATVLGGATGAQLVALSPSALTMIAGVAALVLPLRVLDRRPHRPAVRWLLATLYVAVALAAGFWLTRRAASALSFVVTGFVGAIPWVLVAGLAATFGAAVRSRSWGSDRSSARFGALLVCLGALMQTYPRFDWEHTFWAIAPSIGFMIHAAWQASGRRTMMTALVFILLSWTVAPLVIRSARAKLDRRYVTLSAPPVLRGMRVIPEGAGDWERLAEAIAGYTQAHPQVAILVEGPDALYACFAPNLENPGPFFVTWPGLVSDDGRQRTEFIERTRPLIFRQVPGLLQAIYFGAASADMKAGSSLVDSEMQALRYVPLVKVHGGELLAPGS